MKKIITIALLLFSIVSYAQHNLEFNQVINIKNGDNYTVPTGKTLKIVSALCSNLTVKIPFTNCIPSSGNIYCNYMANTFDFCSIGGVKYTASNLNNSVVAPQNLCSQCPTTMDILATNGIGLSLPIWLKAGEVISIAQGSGMLISAIEFNIVQ